ncbi:hypothetical protein [Caballeronia choica]|nr:hypothetical protein [Caballeronia choica]
MSKPGGIGSNISALSPLYPELSRICGNISKVGSRLPDWNRLFKPIDLPSLQIQSPVSPVSPVHRIFGPWGDTLDAACARAIQLSHMLQDDTKLNELRDELRRAPISDVCTLMYLRNLERQPSANAMEPVTKAASRGAASLKRKESKPQEGLTDKRKQRTDAMKPVIKAAWREATSPKNVHSVWFVLVRQAQSSNPPPPMIGYSVTRGIKWEDSRVKYMTKGAVRLRLERMLNEGL